MEGFKSVNVAFGSKINDVLGSKMKGLSGKMVMFAMSPNEEHVRMVQAGFTIDKENNVYVMKGFGAFKYNVDKKITSIDDLRNYYDEFLESNPYTEVIKLIDEEGYDLVLGPGAPAENGVVYGLGLYCKNYKEIIERQKTGGKQKEQDDRTI